MNNKKDYAIERHETDVLVLGAGASGCGAALAITEAGKKVLLVDKGILESCGSLAGGNDHFMCLFNRPDLPHDTCEDMVKFYAKPTSGFLPETVRMWGRVMPHMLNFLLECGIEFRKNPDGSYMRTTGFGQPGPWWMLIRQGQFLKSKIAKKIREKGADTLERVMITQLLKADGRVCGAVGYGLLDGTLHVIRAKNTVLALGPRVNRVMSNSTGNPFNCQHPPFVTGSHYVLAYEAGARIVCLDTKQATTVLPKAFGCPGMNGITASGGVCLNSKGERFMPKYHPKAESGPRYLFVKGLIKESLEGNGPPFFMDMRHVPADTLDILEHDLMPGDKASWPDYAAQRGLDFATKMMEVEPGDIELEGFVYRNENFESTVPGLFVGCGFRSLSGAICGGYLAGQNAARTADSRSLQDWPEEQELRAEQERILKPLHSEGETSGKIFEQAIREVMNYYMGYVRNEHGLNIALESLKRIEGCISDLYAKNWHELMRINEALHLLKICQLSVLASRERRESSDETMYIRSDYPQADPKFRKMQAMEKKNGEPCISWI